MLLSTAVLYVSFTVPVPVPDCKLYLHLHIPSMEGETYRFTNNKNVAQCALYNVPGLSFRYRHMALISVIERVNNGDKDEL